MACLSPVTLYRDGTYMRVPCGHCVACLNQKAKLYSDLSDIESKAALATFFITLTYSDDNVPILQIIPSAYDDDGVCELTFLCRTPRLLGYYDDAIVDQIDVTDDQYHDMMLPLYDDRVALPDAFKGDCITFAFKQDIVKFLKRVRYYVSKIESKNTQLRYFFCSEYGPRTFRVHYHGLFFVYSSQVKERLPDIIRKAWPYGRIDVQLSGACGCINYVSKYVNSSTSLPIVFKQAATKTWTLHSQYYGALPHASDYKTLATCTYESISNTVYIVSQHYVQNFRIPALQNMLFPRCYRFGVSDFDLCLNRYKCYTILSRLSGQKKVVNIVSWCKSYNYDISLGDYNLLDLLCLSENKESTLSTMLYVSRKFLRLCHRFNVSPYRYYRIILSFYADLDQNNLKEFYTRYETDSLDTSRLPVDFIYRYSNLPVFDRADYLRAFNDGSRDSALLDVYNRIKNYADSIGVDPLICVDVLFDYKNLKDYTDNYTLQHKIASDNVKHKIINDLNNLLYG